MYKLCPWYKHNKNITVIANKDDRKRLKISMIKFEEKKAQHIFIIFTLLQRTHNPRIPKY